MRVLVSWGSRLGGTEGIARIIGDELAKAGIEAVMVPAAEVRSVDGFDAVVLGGGLYAGLWQADAYRFANRHVVALRRIPVWLFSSGPLDASADGGVIAPVTQVAVLMERIGALGHATFGGRLPADAKGFPASAMAKQMSGDWRNPDRIRDWAAGVVRSLPTAVPGPAADPPARSLPRLAAHGFVGWALCAALMVTLLNLVGAGIAIAVHAVAAPLVFVVVSMRYFGVRGARDPLPAAAAFTGIVILLDVAFALATGNTAMFLSIWGTWLPFALIFLASWATGSVLSMMPPRKPAG